MEQLTWLLVVVVAVLIVGPLVVYVLRELFGGR